MVDVASPSDSASFTTWNHAHSFDGETRPAVPLAWPWPAERANAIDALGKSAPVTVRNGQVSVPISVTPVFIATH